MELILPYLLIINAAGFLLMRIDKKKAKQGAWRISEATLMWTAALGGSLGALIGMYRFRHKTNHPKFYLGIPCLLAVQIVAIVVLLSWK